MPSFIVFNSFSLFAAPGFYGPVNRPVTYPKDIHQFFNAPAGFEQPLDFPGAELPHSAVFAQPPIVKAFWNTGRPGRSGRKHTLHPYTGNIPAWGQPARTQPAPFPGQLRKSHKSQNPYLHHQTLKILEHAFYFVNRFCQKRFNGQNQRHS
jgi:hypothetical protein